MEKNHRTDYSIFFKPSSSLQILSKSLINSRLDISNPLSAKKKPLPRNGEGFFFVKLPPEDQAE